MSGELEIHNRIAVLRAERGLSRRELSEALGVHYRTVGYLEQGTYNPSLELAFKLSEFFGLPIEAMFSPRPFEPLSTQVYGSPPDRTGPPGTGPGPAEPA